MGTGERSVAEQGGQRDRGGTAITFRFRVERDRSAIGRFNDSLERELRDAIPQIALRALQVALDELLTNVVMHARQAAGPIEVAVSRSPETLDTQISYLADGFDPTAWQPVGLDVNIFDAIGGQKRAPGSKRMLTTIQRTKRSRFRSPFVSPSTTRPAIREALLVSSPTSPPA